MNGILKVPFLLILADFGVWGFWEKRVLFVCLYSVGKVFVVSSEWGFLIRRKNKVGPKNIFKLYIFFSLLVEAVDYGWLRVKGDEEVQLMK